MYVPTLGLLEPSPIHPEWLVSEPVPIPFFDGQKLPVAVVDLPEADEREVDSAISSFLKLDHQDRLAISPYILASYQLTAKLAADQGYDLECLIASEQAVWQHVRPSAISISRRDRRDCAIYVVISANCDWEPEHGLQIVYRHGSELVRVSPQDGHLTHTDACDLPEEQDRIVG